MASSFTCTPDGLHLSPRCPQGSRAGREHEAGKGAGDSGGARFGGSSGPRGPAPLRRRVPGCLEGGKRKGEKTLAWRWQVAGVEQTSAAFD